MYFHIPPFVPPRGFLPSLIYTFFIAAFFAGLDIRDILCWVSEKKTAFFVSPPFSVDRDDLFRTFLPFVGGKLIRFQGDKIHGTSTLRSSEANVSSPSGKGALLKDFLRVVLMTSYW